MQQIQIQTVDRGRGTVSTEHLEFGLLRLEYILFRDKGDIFFNRLPSPVQSNWNWCPGPRADTSQQDNCICMNPAQIFATQLAKTPTLSELPI